jgi:hypothetical protein
MVTAEGSRMDSLLGLDPARYERHPLHGPDRDYGETNCYTDVLIEFVHALGPEPLAMLGCALSVDFEGDQWTFFKPRPDDLVALFGIDIHEMQPYRPLPLQIAEQLGMGRTLFVELDSFHLPDTFATSYRQDHVKTSVLVEAIDVAAERMRYFHGGGYHELGDEDFREVLRLERELSADVLPPYTELVRMDAGPMLTGEELRAAARDLLPGAVARRPDDNPFRRFGAQLEEEMPNLLAGDSQRFHDYAFATVRMCGSAFEIGASHVGYVLGESGARAAAQMQQIVESSKALSFKLARRREFNPAPSIATMADAWDAAFRELEVAIG